MKGSDKDYKFGPKNNWRRWLWNQVLRRTAGREQREPILYLAGSKDLDRLVTASRVPARNMIAIDRCLDNVASVRSLGGYAICADALDVLRAWPPNVTVAAVVLDLCSGLWKLKDLDNLSALFMAHPALTNAVLAVNFQRGRDAAATEVIDVVNSGVRNWSGIQNEFGPSVGPKHRGWVFATCHAVVACFATRSGHTKVWSTTKLFQPSFFSYRSGVLTFDSVVMGPFASVFVTDDAEGEELIWRGLQNIVQKDARTVRKIAATLATRTRQCSLG